MFKQFFLPFLAIISLSIYFSSCSKEENLTNYTDPTSFAALESKECRAMEIDQAKAYLSQKLTPQQYDKLIWKRAMVITDAFDNTYLMVPYSHFEGVAKSKSLSDDEFTVNFLTYITNTGVEGLEILGKREIDESNNVDLSKILYYYSSLENKYDVSFYNDNNDVIGYFDKHVPPPGSTTTASIYLQLLIEDLFYDYGNGGTSGGGGSTGGGGGGSGGILNCPLPPIYCFIYGRLSLEDPFIPGSSTMNEYFRYRVAVLAQASEDEIDECIEIRNTIESDWVDGFANAQSTSQLDMDRGNNVLYRKLHSSISNNALGQENLNETFSPVRFNIPVTNAWFVANTTMSKFVTDLFNNTPASGRMAALQELNSTMPTAIGQSRQAIVEYNQFRQGLPTDLRQYLDGTQNMAINRSAEMQTAVFCALSQHPEKAQIAEGHLSMMKDNDFYRTAMVSNAWPKIESERYASALNSGLYNPPSPIDPTFTAYYNAVYACNYAMLKSAHPDWSGWYLSWRAHKATMSEIIHGTLDLVGLIPAVGEPADLINGILYTLEGDGINATISFAGTIPIVGVAGTAGRRFYVITQKIGGKVKRLPIYRAASGLLEFGNRSDLRKVLDLPAGDPREAHHLIPWGKTNQPLTQKAAESGWHPNAAKNGEAMDVIRNGGQHGNHPNYDIQVETKMQQEFDRLEQIHGSGNVPPSEAREALEKIQDDLRNNINNNPTIPLNNMNIQWSH